MPEIIEKTILVVDDDDSIHKLLRHYLEKMGCYKVISAESGKEGIKQAIEKKPDFILLDIEMPGEINGFGALENIKANSATSKIPVAMLTARNDRSSVKKAIELKADDYIVKPFNVGTVIGKLDKLLSKDTEKSWEKLNPSQKKILQVAMSSINQVFEWAEFRQEGIPPFEGILGAGEAIVQGINDGEIEGILEAVKDHSGETFKHSLKVSIYLTLFAQSLNKKKELFSPEDIHDFAVGGLIHDLGMVDVSLSILHKPDPLGGGEWVEMRRHVEHTERILKKIRNLNQIQLEIATRHHEKWNGTGYPQGLTGGNIGVPGLMAAIADVYEALTANRSYKKAMSPKEALREMAIWEGHFDEELLERFKQMILH